MGVLVAAAMDEAFTPVRSDVYEGVDVEALLELVAGAWTLHKNVLSGHAIRGTVRCMERT